MELQQHDVPDKRPVEPPIVPHSPRRGGRLKPYIVDIRPPRGTGIEQYWIDSHNGNSAASHAARLAGVTVNSVAKVVRFRLQE